MNLKVTITIDETPNVGCAIKRNDESENVVWNDLTEEEQERIIGALHAFYNLFNRHAKQ